MPYDGEPTNPLGADEFIRLVTSEDIRFLKEDVKNIIEQLRLCLDPARDIKTFGHRLDAKIVSVSVDGGNQPLFEEVPAIGMHLIRVSSGSEELKNIPDSFLHIVRTRNLVPVLYEDQEEVHKKREAELKQLFQSATIKRFLELTSIEPSDIGTSFQRNPQAFVGIVRDVAEWAYIVDIVERYHDVLDIIVVKDGRLEQHGVNASFVTKLRDYFAKREAKVVGVLKHSILLSGSNGISNLVIAEWIARQDEEFYFKVPNQLMQYVYSNERQWNPDDYDTSGRPHETWVFGHRYLAKLYGHTFRPFDTVFALDVPRYFDSKPRLVESIVASVIARRSLLYGGSFGPSVEAHAEASISNHVRKMVEEHIRQESGFHWRL